MTILPIGADTLVYGSNDYGNSVFMSNPTGNAIMEEAGTRIPLILPPFMQPKGRRMNLKKHLVGLPTVGSKYIRAAVDTEGHKGRDSEFFYWSLLHSFND